MGCCATLVKFLVSLNGLITIFHIVCTNNTQTNMILDVHILHIWVNNFTQVNCSHDIVISLNLHIQITVKTTVGVFLWFFISKGILEIVGVSCNCYLQQYLLVIFLYFYIFISSTTVQIDSCLCVIVSTLWTVTVLCG